MSRSFIRHKNPRGKLTHPSQGQELESAGQFTDQAKNIISSKKCEKVLYVTVIYTTEVKEHTDWVNSYVIVEKDSGNHHSPNHTIKRKWRICLDPRDLNEALEREPYNTHSVDEITAKLQGMTVFTIVDFKKGYWMVVLHPESRKLTCTALPFGRFQWTRLPLGTVVAQDIFQSKLDSIFIGMEGVTEIADDMVIAGRHKMDHDRNFLAFMEKCMSNNLTLNLEKIQFKQSQVSFYGHCWSKHSISPDPKKIEALNHMEFPLDKETMRSFLGMINYLNRYSAVVHILHMEKVSRMELEKYTKTFL